MTDQLDLFQDKPLLTRKEDIKSYKSYSRIKTGYHKPLEVIDEDVDIEFSEEKIILLNKEAK
jgi:hypothetical protein